MFRSARASAYTASGPQFLVHINSFAAALALEIAISSCQSRVTFVYLGFGFATLLAPDVRKRLPEKEGRSCRGQEAGADGQDHVSAPQTFLGQGTKVPVQVVVSNELYILKGADRLRLVDVDETDSAAYMA